MEYRERYQFGNIVVVEDDLIGVIVKTWKRMNGEKPGSFYYDIYVRSYNTIKEYDEDDIEHFIYSKELSEEEKDFY